MIRFIQEKLNVLWDIPKEYIIFAPNFNVNREKWQQTEHLR